MNALRGLVALAILAGGFFSLYEVVDAPQSGAFEPVFVRGTGHRVALTFDDGPTPGVTPLVLDALERAHVTATFFVVGRAVRAHPELVRRMARDGFAIESHSDTHAHLNALPPPALAAELDRSIAAIVDASGRRPRWLRPPFGARDAAVLDAARARGLRVVTWGPNLLDGGDTLHFPAPAGALRAQARRLVARVHDGDVVLLHDGERGTGRTGERAWEAGVTPYLVEALRARGFAFVSLDTLAQGSGLQTPPPGS